MQGSEKVRPGDIVGYQVERNKVVFTCEKNLLVQVEQITPGILKFWYDTKETKGPNKSFAVINSGDESIKLNVSEQPQSFEIYTGDLIVRISKSPFQLRIFDKYQKLLMEDAGGRGFEKRFIRDCRL